ncbi:hypothetical protein [Amorphus sp. 3PC139-8]
MIDLAFDLADFWDRNTDRYLAMPVSRLVIELQQAHRIAKRRNRG